MDHYFQTDEFKEKAKQRCLDDFGVEYYSQTSNVKEKNDCYKYDKKRSQQLHQTFIIF